MEFFTIIFNKDSTQLFQELFYKKFLKFDRFVLLFVTISMFFGVIEENFFFQDNRELLIIDNQLYAIFHEGEETDWMLLMRIVNVIISCLLDFCLIERKFFYYQFLKTSFIIDSQKEFLKSFLFLESILECMTIQVQSYPMLDGFYSSRTMNRSSYYYYDTTLNAIFIMIRVGFFLRCLLYLSIFSSAKAYKICFNYGATSNLIFTLRCEFHYSTKRFVIIFVSLYILVFGFMNRLCERSFMQLTSYDWDYVWNSFWIVIIDMTSVGYGDYVPVTNFGRIIIGIAAIGGGAITSLIYITFLEATSFDFREEKAFGRIKAFDSKKNFVNKAKKCISLSLKFNHTRVKLKKDNKSQEYMDDYENFLVDIQKNVKDFSNLRKTIVDFKFTKKIIDIIGFLKEKLTIDFDYVISYITMIDYFEKKTDILLKNVDHLSECISNFEDVYSQVIMSLQYLHEQILDIFEAPNYNLIQDLALKETNYFLVDLINSAQNSVGKLRSSLYLEESEGKTKSRSKTLNNKIIEKLQKNKLITLKKMRILKHHDFHKLNNHVFYINFLQDKMTVKKNDHNDNLMLTNKDKASKMIELWESNQSRNSKLEFQRKSLAYRISVISDSKSNFGLLLESIQSLPSENPMPRKVSKKNFIKRFEKKELTCLQEEKISKSSSRGSKDSSEYEGGSPQLPSNEVKSKFTQKTNKIKLASDDLGHLNIRNGVRRFSLQTNKMNLSTSDTSEAKEHHQDAERNISSTNKSKAKTFVGNNFYLIANEEIKTIENENPIQKENLKIF